MTGAILGRAHAQIVTNRQLNVMRSIVLLQEVDDVVEAGIQNLFCTGRFRADTVCPSSAGNVFGMMSTFVYPPDADARQPETIDSL